MPAEKRFIPKPRSEVVNPQITRLVRLTRRRMILRNLVRWLSKLMVFIWTRSELNGLENIPRKGPALMVTNHLGDADLILGFAYAPPIIEPFAKIELYDIPVLGRILDAYGVIWVHRGQADRRALRAVMDAMREQRMVGIAPEGRESLTGALEEGTDGAAYLALITDAPVIPVTFTGTENKRVFQNMRRFKRTDVSLTVGKPIRLERLPERRASIQKGTEKIMRTLASQLPPEYRGFYEIEG